MTARISLPVLPANAAGVGDARLGPVPRPDLTELRDRFARQVRYLRISVTDRCNYRCVYCVPENGFVYQPRAELMTFEEITRVAAVFAQLGVRKLRLTGGEPTVRAGLPELVARLAGLPGIERVVMTSNGHRLPELAQPLAAAGLHAVNVSIDSADPARFARLSGRGDLPTVVAGIDAARAAGLAVKLNAVALRDPAWDDDALDAEVTALCELAWARDLELRFIEHMPMSGGATYAAQAELSAARLREAIVRRWGPIAPLDAERDAGPARSWRVPGAPGAGGQRFGIISAMTEHFCEACNRVRLTATGELHACLGHDDAISMRDLLRAGADDAVLVGAIAQALDGKRAGHEFLRTGAGGPQKHMISMGG